MIKVFEAFAGVGCQHQALKNIGVDFEIVGISEIDKYAIKSYEALHGKTKNYGDISKVDVNTLPDFDLLTLSFPCQDISLAGKQEGFLKGSNTRSSLLWECERIIRAKKPKYLLMENVKNLVSKKYIDHFNVWLGILEELGYTNYWQVLNSKDYGIPQNRERVFCISILGEHKPFCFPKKENLELKLKDMLESNVDEKYYLSKKQTDKVMPIIINSKLKENVILGSTQKHASVRNDGITPTLTSAMGTGGGHIPMLYNIKEVSNSAVEDNNISDELRLICEERSDEGLRFFKDNICGSIRTPSSGGYKRVIEIATSDENFTYPTIDTVGSAEGQSSIVGETSVDKKTCYDCIEKATKYYDCDLDVEIRKYNVDKDGLRNLLIDAKKKKNLSINRIVNSLNEKNPILNIKKTNVEHWFRRDDCFSIPTPSVWWDLKDILDIKTDIYDKPITEFISKKGEYDYNNRIYDSEYCCPTILTDNNIKIMDYGKKELVAKEHFGRMGEQAVETFNNNDIKEFDTINPFNKKINKDNNICPTITTRPEGFKTAIIVAEKIRIRKLTPRECWRLMGFKDEDIDKVVLSKNSNSQLYKQAGNGIVVPVLERIFEKMFK